MPRHRPRDVHRVLDRLGDAERAIQRDQPADHQGDAAALQALRVTELLTDDRELAQRRVEDPALQIGIALSTKPRIDASSSSSGNSARNP